jgi:ribosomal protein S18 acetylase RimI-like enzyme
MKVIRADKYEPGIYEAIVHLLPQLDPSSEIPSQEYVKKMLKSENISFFIAQADNNEIKGILTLVNYDIISGRKFWIEDVVVDETARGMGVGESLVIAAVDHARNLGAKDISLTSRPSRIAANRLYQKIGFEKYDTNVYRFSLK